MGTPVPTLQSSAAMYPDADEAELQLKHDADVALWQELNTQFYYLVDDHIDVSGPYDDTDRAMIKEEFVRQDGPQRDGLGLFNWATSYHKPDSKESQLALEKQLREFHLGPNITRYYLVLSINTLLRIWRSVSGNSSEKLLAFWDLLVESMHSDPKENTGIIRVYLANRLIDKTPLIYRLAEFIGEIEKYAKLVGMPDGTPGDETKGVVMGIVDNNHSEDANTKNTKKPYICWIYRDWWCTNDSFHNRYS